MKKILPVILCGTMLAISAFAFAGCGHKHSYEISYQIADCDSVGYTLHTCTGCGDKYANEFVEPLGHALRTYYHIEEENENEVQAASYALTESRAGSQYSLFTSVSQDALDLLEKNKDKYTFCKHVGCEFCDQVNWGGTGEHKVVDYDTMVDEMKKAEAGGEKRSTINIPSIETKDGKDVPKATISAGEFDTLIAGTQNKFELIIPDSVQIIADRAFSDCTRLDRVKLSSNVFYIGSNAFKGAKLPYIVIPKSVGYIAPNAFGSCENMQAIYYCGTEEEWNKIVFESDLERLPEPLKNVKRYYYSDTAKPSNNVWHYDRNGEPVVHVKIYYGDWLHM